MKDWDEVTSVSGVSAQGGGVLGRRFQPHEAHIPYLLQLKVRTLDAYLSPQDRSPGLTRSPCSADVLRQPTFHIVEVAAVSQSKHVNRRSVSFSKLSFKAVSSELPVNSQSPILLLYIHAAYKV